MRIKTILDQNRRDFTAVYECEHCHHEETKYGYDDDNFHSNLIPDMKCKSCGETGPDTYRPRKTKYRKDEVV